MFFNPSLGEDSMFAKILLVEGISWQQERNPPKNQNLAFLF